ncbi:phosphoribosyl-ATP pyrophosphohydrolase [Methanomicrobium sp. W14]|uniref:phosphoribosyl-ATP diphosphatase n=1 Tax=Methanomicrobium sp. W14 TaxID=2817839 RepID=UPI001AE16CE3|nr:phosphoribosyl-ATP diphosphatase [Methanomicrobium sp. W14]MBP2134603.1 phosphoribosyl-ATP pyrophosphohydrolase [Methanomicrobium sp. W14]
MNTDIFEEIWNTICTRVENPPEKSYVVDILTHRKGIDKALEKVGEEATEFIIAAKNDDYEQKVYEAADLFFHLMLALRGCNVEFSDVIAELERRRK